MLVKTLNKANLDIEINRLRSGAIQTLGLAFANWKELKEWRTYLINNCKDLYDLTHIFFFMENDNRQVFIDITHDGPTLDAILFSHGWKDTFYRSNLLNMGTDKYPNGYQTNPNSSQIIYQLYDKPYDPNHIFAGF